MAPDETPDSYVAIIQRVYAVSPTGEEMVADTPCYYSSHVGGDHRFHGRIGSGPIDVSLYVGLGRAAHSGIIGLLP